MNNETILRGGQILSFERRAYMTDDEALRFSRVIEQAVLQSPEIQALRSLVQEVDGCFNAAYSEGLSEALAETSDERLKDLVKRRLLHAHYAAKEQQT